MSSHPEFISVAVRSRWLSLGGFLDCLSSCHSVGYSVCWLVIFHLVRWPCSVVGLRLFGMSFGTLSISIVALGRHGSGSFVLWRLGYLCRCTGRPSYGRWTCRHRSYGALAGSPPLCWFIFRCACHHLNLCTYRRSLSPLVDSFPCSLDAAYLLNCWMYLAVLRSCTSGTAIVCGMGCESGTVIPLLMKPVAPLPTNLIRLDGEYWLEGLDSEVDLPSSSVILVV